MSKKNKEPHPTLFVLEGSIRIYPDGSMLELHSKVTIEEWEIIVSDTIHYKVFIDCLKEVACPILEEPWTKEDDYFRIQMGIAVSRIRNIDPLLVAKFDQKKIMQEYRKKAQKNAQVLKAEINEMKQQQQQLLNDMKQGGDTTRVSDL
jgi:hypothetical protein